MAIGLLVFLVVLGVLIGTGQAKNILVGVGMLGAGILILLTPVWLFLAYLLVWFIGIESYEALGPLGPLIALLTPWAVAAFWKRRLGRVVGVEAQAPERRGDVLVQEHDRQERDACRGSGTAESKRDRAAVASLTWGERIAQAADIRRAYPPTQPTRLSDRRGP